ncbi:MAG: hypothetical protein J7647_18260 [Cyanobacteria bacterium SBLK]|nr:hypothetical protein [Cyanobacteria bacterium SBLK]
MSASPKPKIPTSGNSSLNITSSIVLFFLIGFLTILAVLHGFLIWSWMENHELGIILITICSIVFVQLRQQDSVNNYIEKNKSITDDITQRTDDIAQRTDDIDQNTKDLVQTTQGLTQRTENVVDKIQSSYEDFDNKIKEINSNIESKFNSINAKTKKIDERIEQGLIKEKAGLITDMDTTDIFKEFTGEYIAFNDPLQHSSKSREERIKLHIQRYQDDSFKKAYYYYPIFSHPDESWRDEWLRNVKEFWKIIDKSQELNAEHKEKLRFFVPKNKGFQYHQTSEITYFIGRKNTGFQAIICLYNRVFMDMKLNIPKRMLVIYDEKTIDEIENHIREEVKNMQSAKNIGEFLEYLNQKSP